MLLSAADGRRLRLITDVGETLGTQKTARVSNNGPGFSQGIAAAAAEEERRGEIISRESLMWSIGPHLQSAGDFYSN